MIKYKEFYERRENMLCTWKNIVSERYHERGAKGVYSVHNENTVHLNMEFNELIFLFLYRSDQYFILMK